MKNLEKLSFENIRVTQGADPIFGKYMKIMVIDSNYECLAEAKCSTILLKDFISEWFYSEILESEINYFFLDVFNDEERNKTNSMGLDKYVAYINNKYGEDEASTLNNLYKIYINLKNYNSKNIFNSYNTCIRINSIDSNYDNTGAGTLIVDYLKENYELIFLYGIEEAQGYWLNKVNFKEILNGYMYWTNNKELNKILKNKL